MINVGKTVPVKYGEGLRGVTKAEKEKSLTQTQKLLAGFKKFGKWALWIAGVLLLVTIVADLVVASYIYSLVEDFASDYHWLSRWAGFISVVFALAFSFPLLLAMATCLVGMGKVKHWVTLALCVAITIFGAYNSRFQYFAVGAGDKEICPPLIVTEKIRVDSKGVGAKYGKTCVSLTKENVALAYTIEKSGVAPKEFFIFGKELHNLKLIQNGVPALYRGTTLSDGTFRLYEGPWFDEDVKGTFTKPVLNIKELEPLHKLVHEKHLKEAKAMEASEMEREGKMAAEEERRQERNKKDEEKKAKLAAKAEAEKVAKQKVREAKIVEAKEKEEKVGLGNVESWTVRYGWRISVKGKHVQLKLPGDPAGTNREMTDDLFKKNNGKVIAVPMNCFWCGETWLKIEPIVPD